MTSKTKTSETRRQRPEKTSKKTSAKKLRSQVSNLSSPASHGPATARALLKQSWDFLWVNRRIWARLVVIHAVLYIVLTGILSASLNISELRQQIIDQLGGNASSLRVNLEIFGSVLRTANGAGAVDGSVYQSLLFVFSSLAFIWAIRELKAGKSFKARIAYYRGQHQIIPFILVLLMIGVQLIPFALANWLLAILTSDTVAVHTGERVAAWVLWAIVSLPTFYMLSASVIALYIVTLPNTMPMQALRKARELAKYRRWLILRRLLSLVVAIVVVVSVIVLATIYLVPLLAVLVTVLIMVLILPFTHIYLYNLYRSLL